MSDLPPTDLPEFNDHIDGDPDKPFGEGGQFMTASMIADYRKAWERKQAETNT